MGKTFSPFRTFPHAVPLPGKLSPASFYTNANLLFRSQLKSYFCKKVFPGHSLHNLKFSHLLIISHNWCYLASYPIPICDYPCVWLCLISDTLHPIDYTLQKNRDKLILLATLQAFIYIFERKKNTYKAPNCISYILKLYLLHHSINI